MKEIKSSEPFWIFDIDGIEVYVKLTQVNKFREWLRITKNYKIITTEDLKNN